MKQFKRSKFKLTKSDLVENIALQYGIEKKEALEALDLICTGIKQTLLTVGMAQEQDVEINIPKFGIFRMKHIPEYKMVFGVSGEEITVPTKKRIIFSPSLDWKKIIGEK